MNATNATVSFGPFLLDLQRGELLRAGELVAIAPKPLALLAYLAANRDRTVSKDELLTQVWPDVFVSEAALASALKDLRRAIGDDGARQRIVYTMRRRGYRFVARLNRSGTAASRRRSPSPASVGARPAFVARTRELRLLTALALQASRGRPQLAVLVGDPGSGKTRLLEELLAHPACAPLAAAVGRCKAEGLVPYLPFAEALNARLDEDDGEVGAEDAALLRPLLQPDVPGAPPDDALGSGDAQRERADLFAAAFGLLGRLARRRATVLAIEDLHCADSASLALLADLVAACSEARSRGDLPLLIVATLRTPREGDRVGELLRRLQQAPIASAITLEGLGVSATRRLLDGLGVASTQARAREIQARTDGNPLFIREVARDGSPFDAGARDRQDGLRHALAARIEKLGAASRSFLSAAAFIGERFGPIALAGVCRCDEAVARAGLREAVSAELLVAEAHSYRFDHPLVRDVLREGTPELRRRELHRDIAAVLQDLYATSPGDHAMEIGHHLVEAGDLVDAVQRSDYARRAGDQAFALCAWREAAYFHAAAVKDAAHLAPRELGRGHLRAGIAANHDCDVAGCLAHYAQAARASDAAGDDVGLAWSLMYLLRARLTFPSRQPGAELDVRPLEELAQRLGETHPSLRALLWGTISEAHWSSGEIELAQASAERAVAIGKLYDDGVACHHSLISLGLVQLAQLRAREALESWLESAQHARRAHDLWLQATPGPRIALAELHLGRLEEARAQARAAAELARRAHHHGELGLATAILAGIESAVGAFEEAERSAATARAAAERSNYPWAGVYALCGSASAATHRGVWQKADEALGELIAPGRVFTEPGAAVRFMAAAFGALVAARRDARAVDSAVVSGLIRSLQGRRLDPYLLGAVCALGESCAALGDATLAKRPEELLRLAHDRGIAFTAGWVILLPRVIGQLAALDARWDEAESWLERAIAFARGSGARVELALSLCERARVRAERRDGGRDGERARSDLDEATALFEELGLSPSLRSALTLRRGLRGAD
ncbi:MAG TPA: AAA family ATPase [Myxococcota bacterium]|nr:AAA family ATPase [Myxococcota bacterium]